MREAHADIGRELLDDLVSRRSLNTKRYAFITPS
jgi:hypothetical protein